MARLRIPEACFVCGIEFAVGDRIEFTRRATIVPGYPQVYRYGRGRGYGLEPHVESQSPRNVQHLECPVNGSDGGG